MHGHFSSAIICRLNYENRTTSFRLSLFLSCRNEDDALLCDEKATLRDFTGLDGCAYVLVLDNDNEEVLEIGELEFEPDFTYLVMG